MLRSDCDLSMDTKFKQHRFDIDSTSGDVGSMLKLHVCCFSVVCPLG